MRSFRSAAGEGPGKGGGAEAGARRDTAGDNHGDTCGRRASERASDWGWLGRGAGASGQAALMGVVGSRWRSARGATVRPPLAPAPDAVLTASVSGGRVALVTDAEGVLFVVGEASAGCPRLHRNLGEDLGQLRQHAPEIRASAGERAPCSLLPPLGTRDAGVLWNLFPESSAADHAWGSFDLPEILKETRLRALGNWGSCRGRHH